MGISLIATSLFSLYILSLPLVAVFLASTQQKHPALNNKQLQQSDAQAIVVLGGGTRPPAPEYDNKIVLHQRVFDRLRYTVRLAKKTNLPVLVSAGKVFDHSQSAEADVIQETLIADFQFKADWLEDESRNTAENAHYSYVLLNKEKIHRIILVTQAMHMARAVEQFRNSGFQVTPAPTAFISYPSHITALSFIPAASSLNISSMTLHEFLGRWWYRLRYKTHIN